MKKYAKVINEETKEVSIAISENPDVLYFERRGFTLQEVEQAYDGGWYLSGYAPEKPEPTIEEQNEAIRQTREQLYIQTSDKLKADYDEAVARGAKNAEELKTAWLESKDKIREENPYIEEESEVIEDGLQREETEVVNENFYN